MTAPTLCLRISRRAIAAVALSGEQLPFHDARHLRSRNQAATDALSRYVQLILDQVHPRSVVIDCPSKHGSATGTLVNAARDVLARAHVACHDIDSATLCLAFGGTRAVTRLQMRALVEPMFSEFLTVRTTAKPYIVDAAAVALVVESGAALGTFPT